jgi:low affinity Fe/Cu permease
MRKAIHLKLDELLKGVKGARTGLVNLEQLSDAELENLQKEFARLHEAVKHEHQRGDEQQIVLKQAAKSR